MSQASAQQFNKNQIIFREDSMESGLYKIISGSIAFYQNYGTKQERLIGVSFAPNYFGMMGALTGQNATCTAVAREQSLVLYLPNNQLETFAKNDPANALGTMRTLARELRMADERMNSLLKQLRVIAEEDGETARKIAPLLERYPAAQMRILDAMEQPEWPKPVEKVPAPAAVGRIVIRERNQAPDMPEPYLKGHRGYPGVTHPEYKKYLFREDLVCPHCHQKFVANRIQVSKLIPTSELSEEKRYDLRIRYNDFEMEWHEIVTCPSCWFSAFESFFRENKRLYRDRYENDLARLRDTLTVSFYSEPDLETVFAQHYLALVCAPGFTDSRQIIARVWMNLVRLYQDAGEDELSDIAEQKALEANETVYKEVELTEGQEQRLCLTQAGILYARGEKQAARAWAVRVRRGSNDRTAYWNMAEQLIQDVRAEMKVENA